MVQVQATRALLDFMLKQRKIIYSDAGRKIGFTELIKTCK